jgi:hypothetical protein
VLRRATLKRSTNPLIVLAAAALIGFGCDNYKQLPDSPYPGASRDLMENPLGAAKKTKALTAKQKAAMENAKKADPRGK